MQQVQPHRAAAPSRGEQQHRGSWQSAGKASPLGRRALTCVCAVKQKSGKQVACTKTLVAKPDQQGKVAALVADLASFSLQRARDRASGVQVFEVVRDQFEPNTFHIWERYESNAALGRHNVLPEYQAFMSKVIALAAQGIRGRASFPGPVQLAQLHPSRSPHSPAPRAERRCSSTWRARWPWRSTSGATGS